MDKIIIAGNGISRKRFDLSKIKQDLGAPLYVCNLGYIDLPYDKVFAIDEKVIASLVSDNVPVTLVDEDMKWEPDWRETGIRPRNNTGMVAMQYAINEGYKHLVIFGFDFMSHDIESKMSNVFAGHELYGPETACSYEDTFERAKYLEWMMSKNTNCQFDFIS